MIGLTRLRISFSNTFEEKGKRFIGLHDERVSAGLAGFDITIIIETFNSSGK